MARLNVAGLIAVALQGTAFTTLSAIPTPAIAQAAVPARAGRCLRSNFVVEREGYYDRSRVEITNTCNQVVTGWQCIIAVYGPGSRGCDPRFGGYGAVTYPPGKVARNGMSSSASPTVDLLECPTGYRPSRPLECVR